MKDLGVLVVLVFSSVSPYETRWSVHTVFKFLDFGFALFLDIQQIVLVSWADKAPAEPHRHAVGGGGGQWRTIWKCEGREKYELADVVSRTNERWRSALNVGPSVHLLDEMSDDGCHPTQCSPYSGTIWSGFIQPVVSNLVANQQPEHQGHTFH